MKPFIFYSHHAQELEGTVGDKIKKLVDGDLIEYKKAEGNPKDAHYEPGRWLIHPIEGYNTRTYTVKPSREYGHSCNCQAFVTREKKYREGGQTSGIPKPTCSHVAAVYEWFSRMHRVRKQEHIKQAVLTMFG